MHAPFLMSFQGAMADMTDELSSRELPSSPARSDSSCFGVYSARCNTCVRVRH